MSPGSGTGGTGRVRTGRSVSIGHTEVGRHRSPTPGPRPWSFGGGRRIILDTGTQTFPSDLTRVVPLLGCKESPVGEGGATTPPAPGPTDPPVSGLRSTVLSPSVPDLPAHSPKDVPYNVTTPWVLHPSLPTTSTLLPLLTPDP